MTTQTKQRKLARRRDGDGLSGASAAVGGGGEDDDDGRRGGAEWARDETSEFVHLRRNWFTTKKSQK